MKEIFNQVIEKEKDADSKIQDAKDRASALLLSVEAENREKIKLHREALQAKYNEEIQAFTDQVKANEEKCRREAEQRLSEELGHRGEIITRCAERVFEILIGNRAE